MSNVRILHMLHCKLLVFQRKVAKLFNCTLIYCSNRGIKSVNPIISNNKYKAISQGFIEPDKLYLGVDFLKDKYTLCGVNIKNSPHYTFLEALKKNNDIVNSDYCKRYSNGTLDSRIPTYINAKTKNSFKTIFQKRIEEMKDNKLKPVLIYKLCDKYYIADGKHRAALYTLYKKKVPYIEISTDYLIDSYRLWMYNKMQKKKELFTTNIAVYDSLYKCLLNY